MGKDDKLPSALGGFASFVNGATWLGQPPRRQRDKWDEDHAPARWEVPLAVVVTASLVLVGVVVVGLAYTWSAAWLGGLAGLFSAAIVMQPLYATLRRVLS